jgi:hypothetical protein
MRTCERASGGEGPGNIKRKRKHNTPITVYPTAALEKVVGHTGGVDDHEGFAEYGHGHEVACIGGDGGGTDAGRRRSEIGGGSRQTTNDNGKASQTGAHAHVGV